MCPIHHDVIDADVLSYTVERLRQMKAACEPGKPSPEPTDSIIKQFLVSLDNADLRGASVVISANQIGGQVANVINNFGPPKRVLTKEMRLQMSQVLSAVEPSMIGLASTHGDSEAHEFKLQLMNAFSDAGWKVIDMQTFMFFGSKRGLVLTIPFSAPETGLAQVVAHALAQTGNPLEGNKGDMANDCGLFVQVWSAP